MVKGLTDLMKTYEPFLSERGREDLVDAIRAYKRTYGDRWLTEFKGRMPHLCEIIDLCANYEFEPAFGKLLERIEELIDQEPNIWMRTGLRVTTKPFIDGAKPDIQKLHAVLRAEIDRPRF